MIVVFFVSKTMMILYSQMTHLQKISLVIELRKDRLKLLDESKKKRAKKGKRKTRKKKELQFSSPLLKDLFNNMDKESLKFLTGKG